MKNLHQKLLLVSVVLGSWLGMQAVHEAGHILGATLSGGRVARVVLHPLTLSRTDLTSNPRPLVVAWAGPLAGVLLPLLFWGAAAAARRPVAFVLRFFAGFCLVANGAYLAVGSLEGVGDAGELLRLGAPRWQLLGFGLAAIPLGLRLWHRQGRHFGLGPDADRVRPAIAYVGLVAFLLLFALGLVVGRG